MLSSSEYLANVVREGNRGVRANFAYTSRIERTCRRSKGFAAVASFAGPVAS